MNVVLWNIGQQDFYQKMFIKVEKDILDIILQTDRNKKRERAIDVFVQLMTSSRMNYHKVYLKCSLTADEEKLLKAAVDENSWREFLKLQRERFDVEGFIALLDIYAVITTSKHCSRVGKELIVNPLETPDFLLGMKTYLATENQRDGVLYQRIAELFKRSKRLSNMNSSFVKWKGGGSDFGGTLKSDEILNCNFVFAIADSDKHCPSDKIGKTAKGIKFLGHNRFNADYYILNDVLEVENLIPYKIVQDIFPRISELMYYDLSYFDFKKGLTHTTLYDKERRSYWKSNFTGLYIDWEQVETLAKEPTFSMYCDAVHGMKSLIPGFGSDLLESALCMPTWSSITDSDLTSSQQKEWNILGKKIFSWTCCSQKRL